MNSQNNEEQLIIDYFRGRVGTALDIGANDGITLSNSYAAIMRGWSGVLVEPSPEAFDRLSDLYADNDKVECIMAAIGTMNARMDLHDSGEHLGTGDVALLSTLLSSERVKWEMSGNTFTLDECDVITFQTLLDAHTRRKHFDLITIDAEGMDLDILRQMDLTALGCDMLIIEHEHSDINAMLRYGRKHGLKELTRNRQNLIMAR